MYAENGPAMKRNEAVPGELYTIEPNDKNSDNCKQPLALMKATHNEKQRNTEDLATFWKMKIGAKVMLTVNIDIWDRL